MEIYLDFKKHWTESHNASIERRKGESNAKFEELAGVPLDPYLKLAFHLDAAGQYPDFVISRNKVLAWTDGSLPAFVEARISQLESPREWSNWSQAVCG